MYKPQISKAVAAALASCAVVVGIGVPVGFTASQSAWAQSEAQEAATSNVEQVSKARYYGAFEGFDTAEDWEAGIDERVAEAHELVDKAVKRTAERDDVNWTKLRGEIAKVNDELEHVWSVETADAAVEHAKGLDKMIDEMIAERDAEIEAERIAAEEAAAAEAAAAAAYYDSGYYGGYSGGGGYNPTGGLTPQSGVNYYGDQRETYYSSNVLYHYQTSQWQVDDEGFYREGDYYVVAANDGQYQNGDTYEGSKGTCIVRDSGCDYGTTDYYVAW